MRWLRTILALILIGTLALPVLLYHAMFNPWNDRRFDAAVWAANENSRDPDNPRGQMYTDLRRHYLKSGTLREEVIELLGGPIGTTASHLSYNLGMWSMFRIDYDTLEIEFDADGRLATVYHLQH